MLLFENRLISEMNADYTLTQKPTVLDCYQTLYGNWKVWFYFIKYYNYHRFNLQSAYISLTVTLTGKRCNGYVRHCK